MKVAITSSGPGPENMMDDRLGRCPYFIVMDTVKGTFETFENRAAQVSSGAGTKATQALLDLGADVVITGKIGPHASAMLADTDIELITGASGKVMDVLEDFKKKRGL